VLGVTEAQWPEIDAHWQKAMAEDEPFALATQLGEVFGNPAVGKFAGAEATTSEDHLMKVPDLESYLTLVQAQALASDNGIAHDKVLELFGLDLNSFTQLGVHYGPAINEYTEGMSEHPARSETWNAMLQRAEHKAASILGVQPRES